MVEERELARREAQQEVELVRVGVLEAEAEEVLPSLGTVEAAAVRERVLDA